MTAAKRQRRREGGAAMVEMAVVLPLLLLLVIGILEYGLLFGEKLTIAAATSSATRTGATMGQEDTADIRILEAVEAGLYSQVDSEVLISVEIFLADEVTGARVASKVNTYVFDSSVSCKWIPCPDPLDPSFAYGGSWVPEDRNTTLFPGGGGLDVLGVEVTYFHDSITDLIPGVSRAFHERALVRLEPDAFGTGP
jgi:hypothetical protein